MINKDSIVSAFNSRGTLLKWLKMVNSKLDNGLFIHSERLKFDVDTNHYVLIITTLSSTPTPFNKTTFIEFEDTILTSEYPLFIYWSNDEGFSGIFTATAINTSGDTIPVEPSIKYINFEGTIATIDFSKSLSITYTDKVTRL